LVRAPCFFPRPVVFGAVTNLMLRGGSGDELVLEPPSQFADQAPARFSLYAEPVLRLHFSEAFACRNTRSKDGCGSFAKALRAAMPGAGVPSIGMREGGVDRVAVLCYSPKNELSCYRD
jgi:hypothetical protein